jgi:hypothetical protein
MIEKETKRLFRFLQKATVSCQGSKSSKAYAVPKAIYQYQKSVHYPTAAVKGRLSSAPPLFMSSARPRDRAHHLMKR